MKVFLYGTLKSNKGNSKYIYGKFLNMATTDKTHSLYIGVFPFLKKEKGPGVIGELWEVDRLMLDWLDHFEGHPNFYKRKRIDVIDADGRNVRAWTYYFQKGIHPQCRKVKEF